MPKNFQAAVQKILKIMLLYVYRYLKSFEFVPAAKSAAGRRGISKDQHTTRSCSQCTGVRFAQLANPGTDSPGNDHFGST
jgi:hypothetical protein